MRLFHRLLLAVPAMSLVAGARPFPGQTGQLRSASSVSYPVHVRHTPGRLAIARLQYDGGGDWYANPSGIPNLLTHQIIFTP